MPTLFATGLSGGAAANVINVVQWHMGRRIVRSTTNHPGVTSPRTVLSRLAVNEGQATSGAPYTVVNS